MINRKILFPVAGAMLLLLLCSALLPAINWIVSSFPEILMGQRTMARQTKPISPRSYKSVEVILGQTVLSEIEGAVFIALDEDVLFWDPQYIGFPRTELNPNEINILQQMISSGDLFYQTADSESYQCVYQVPGGEPALENCSRGKQLMERYISYKWDAQQNHTVGVLQFFLTGERLAEIRIYHSKSGLAYTPYEKSGERQLHGIAASSSLLDELSARVTLPSVSVLWPEMTANQANKHGAGIIGKQYRLALAILNKTPAVKDVFGEIQEVRPANGLNYYTSWMDSSSVLLTFRVIGTHGEGAVIVRGYDCFDVDMVFMGIPVNGGSSNICP